MERPGSRLGSRGVDAPLSRRFRNQTPTGPNRFRDFVKWMRTREPGPWQKWTEIPPATDPPHRVGRGAMRLTFVNHSTVLVQMDGLNILTDPIWSKRASPVSFAGPKRVHAPGLRWEQLPPIDVALVSHNHYDHLDVETLDRLAAEHRPRIFVPRANRDMLVRRGLRDVHELDWWGSAGVREGIRVTAVPAQHFSGRGLFDRDHALWSGFVVSGPAGAMYFAGDTGFGPHFRQIRERLGPPRLALLPIRAYRPEWFMSRVRTSPDEALDAHEVLGADVSAAIHFGTFRLADDGENEAPARIEALLRDAVPPRPQFWILGSGEARDVPSAAPKVDADLADSAAQR